MVCSKCQKLGKGTTVLATPSVKKKSEIYHGSSANFPSSSSSSQKGTKAASASSSSTGIGKNKLLSKAAKNPYAQYASSCSKCKTRVSQGHDLCQGCAYRADACPGCGKANKKKTKGAGPTVEGHKNSMK